MTDTEIRSLALHIALSDASDEVVQDDILERVRTLRDQLVAGGPNDLTACLEAALLLTEYRNDLKGTGPSDVTRIVSKLVGIAEGLHAGPMPTRPSRLIKGSGSALPRSPGKPLSSTLEKSSLRLVSDLVLGEMLVELGTISDDQLAQALEIQRAMGVRIGEALVSIHAATWGEVQEGVKLQHGFRQGSGVAGEAEQLSAD